MSNDHIDTAIALLQLIKDRQHTMPSRTVIALQKSVQEILSYDNTLFGRVKEAYETRSKIHAIKIYKDATGLGLKEVKDQIEFWAQTHFWAKKTQS